MRQKLPPKRHNFNKPMLQLHQQQKHKHNKTMNSKLYNLNNNKNYKL